MGRNLIPISLIVTAVALGASTAAIAESGWYVGGSLGETILQHGVDDFDDGSLDSTGRVDEKDSGWKLYGGYRFNRHLALEGGFTVLNNDYDSETTFSDGRSDGSGVFPAGGVGFDIHRPQATFAAAVAILPVAKRFDLRAKLGAHVWEAEVTTFRAGGIFEEDESGIDPVAGLGLEYRFAQHWALRAEYERFMNIVDDDIDLVSLGVSYGFGR